MGAKAGQIILDSSKIIPACIQMCLAFSSTVRWRSAQILASLLAVTELTTTTNTISSEASEDSEWMRFVEIIVLQFESEGQLPNWRKCRAASTPALIDYNDLQNLCTLINKQMQLAGLWGCLCCDGGGKNSKSVGRYVTHLGFKGKLDN
ncbi:hypothetical protein DIRU0_B10814 [Diutina rugosa]